MSSTLVAEPRRARSRALDPQLAPARNAAASLSKGSPAGMPGFLQLSNTEPLVQSKCACGGQGSTKCTHCQEKEERLRLSGTSAQTNGAHYQTDEEDKRPSNSGQSVQPKNATSSQQRAHHNATPNIHSTAREGVAGANQPLPHLDRIQAAFGRHDVRLARSAVGCAATRANERMGSLAYTEGDRIGFRSEPDVKLAAHEAAHVVQQRSGAKLPGGVGRPGDEYERQADAAAAAVDRGESAEPIFDRTIPGGPSGSAPVVQHSPDTKPEGPKTEQHPSEGDTPPKAGPPDTGTTADAGTSPEDAGGAPPATAPPNVANAPPSAPAVPHQIKCSPENPCPKAPPRTVIPANCPQQAPVPGNMPPKTEPPPELPVIPNERFGGDSVVADFAEKLACCEAQRKAAGEVASRFEKAKSAAAKAEDEQAKKDQEKAIQEAIEKLEKPEKEDAKYRREVARVTRIAKAEAQKEAVAKKKAAVAAITREDLGAVQQELAQWILDDLSDDFLKSMNEAIKEYADTWRKPMLRAITKERTAQEKKLTPKAKPRPKSKPKVVTAPEPPEPEPPTREQILEEVEASLVRVRCEQQAWVANRLESFKHAWMAGRRERVDFRTSVPTVPERALKWGTEFKAPDVPEADRVPIPDDLKDSPGEKQPPIAPELLSFLRRLQRLEPGVKAGNYGDPPHGSLGFAGKGFSVDLSLTGNKAGPLDERGFYPHDAAVNLLLHIDEASKVADAEWDVIYNDFTVAEEVNRKLKTRRVSYVGGLDKTGRLNWHGPAPLKLHFHLDYMPKMDKPDPEAEKIRSAHLMFKILKLLLPVPSAPAAPGLKKKK